MGFSGQEYWSGLQCPPPDLPNPGIKPGSLALQADSFPSEPLRKLDSILLSVHGVFVQKCPAALPTPEQMAPAQTLLRLQRLGRERTGSVSQHYTWEPGLRGDTITSDHPLVSLPGVILMHVMDFTPRIRFHHRTAQLTAGFPGCTMLKYPPASLVDVG